MGKNTFDLKTLKIIKDPYSNIYKQGSEWVHTCEVLAFSLIADTENKVEKNLKKAGPLDSYLVN